MGRWLLMMGNSLLLMSQKFFIKPKSGPRTFLHLPPSLHGLTERHLICEFNIPSHWKSISNTRYLNIKRFQKLPDILGSHLAFSVRICCEDYFFYSIFLNSFYKLLYL